jgi:hypothetical protein
VGDRVIAIGIDEDEALPQGENPVIPRLFAKFAITESFVVYKFTAGVRLELESEARENPPIPPGVFVALPFQLPPLTLIQRSLFVRSTATSTVLPDA